MEPTPKQHYCYPGLITKEPPGPAIVHPESKLAMPPPAERQSGVIEKKPKQTRSAPRRKIV